MRERILSWGIFERDAKSIMKALIVEEKTQEKELEIMMKILSL